MSLGISINLFLQVELIISEDNFFVLRTRLLPSTFFIVTPTSSAGFFRCLSNFKTKDHSLRQIGDEFGENSI